jgi:hypothetical protein
LGTLHVGLDGARRRDDPGSWTIRGVLHRIAPQVRRYAGSEGGCGRELLRRAVSLFQVGNAIRIWLNETLEEPEDDEVRAENNSSVILLLQIDGEQILLTADAGVPALTRAYGRALGLDIDLTKCCFYQVPHHGSRRNISPSILDLIVGPRLQIGTAAKATAYVSAAPEAGPKHPSSKVTNAFRRRGVNVVATQGNTLCYSRNAPQRYGWVPVTAIPLLIEETEE